MVSSNRTRRAQSLAANAVRYNLDADVIRVRRTAFQVARALDAIDAIDGAITSEQATELHAAVESLRSAE